jgi:hypothetical protein
LIDGAGSASKVKALEHGENSIAFETALKDSRTTEEGDTTPISGEHVNQALKAITETVFSKSLIRNLMTLDEQKDI